jgi:arylformamidase
MKLIDLTHPIKSNMPVYPGDPETKIQQEGSIKKDGYVDHYLSIGTHAGTHIDAPSHMLENKKSLNQFPLEKFIGRGVCIKRNYKSYYYQK